MLCLPLLLQLLKWELETWEMRTEVSNLSLLLEHNEAGGEHSFSPWSFGPWLHCISPTFHDLHHQSEPFPVVL